MKNVLFLLLVVFGFISCEWPWGYDGYDGVDGSFNMHTRTFIVKGSYWMLMGTADYFGSYYYYYFNVVNCIDDYMGEVEK